MLLTKEEREYLEQVLRPFHPFYLRKDITSDKTREFITVSMKDTDSLIFPFFLRGKYYRSLEIGRNYTMEELDLEKSSEC